MAKVFVVQDDGRFDLTDTRRFGDPVVVFRKDLYPDNSDEQMPHVMTRAYGVLSEFNPNSDYLCLVGSPLYAAVCSYVLGDLAVAPVRLLRFDRLESKYYAVTIE